VGQTRARGRLFHDRPGHPAVLPICRAAPPGRHAGRRGPSGGDGVALVSNGRGQRFARGRAVHIDLAAGAVDAHGGAGVDLLHRLRHGALAVAAGHALDLKAVGLHGGVLSVGQMRRGRCGPARSVGSRAGSSSMRNTHRPRSLSDLEIVGCKPTAAVHF
jgi:hypothetical protein